MLGKLRLDLTALVKQKEKKKKTLNKELQCQKIAKAKTAKIN